jgi:phosphoglycerate kinase
MNFPVVKGDISGKAVILRVDINSPVNDGKVMDNDRIVEAAKSIDFLKRKGAKVIVLAHQGRKGKEDFLGLGQHAALIGKRTRIKFVDDISGEKAAKAIGGLKNGEAVLLENVRFLDSEMDFSSGARFVPILSDMADIYVNDAFSVSHRRQASIVLFPERLPSFIGPAFASELKALEKVKMKGALHILAGSKAEENMLFLKKGKKIVVAGIFGQMCLKARGLSFGKHDGFLGDVGTLKRKLKGVKIIGPEDFAVKMGGRRVEIRKEKFPNEHEILDIGAKSIRIFCGEIKKAKAVLMKGPAGYIEDKKFRKGTEALLREIARSKAFSVIGGGHLSTALREMNINKKSFGHVSLGGGAFASHIAGKKLPGLEAIMKQKRTR